MSESPRPHVTNEELSDRLDAQDLVLASWKNERWWVRGLLFALLAAYITNAHVGVDPTLTIHFPW